MSGVSVGPGPHRDRQSAHPSDRLERPPFARPDGRPRELRGGSFRALRPPPVVAVWRWILHGHQRVPQAFLLLDHLWIGKMVGANVYRPDRLAGHAPAPFHPPPNVSNTGPYSGLKSCGASAFRLPLPRVCCLATSLWGCRPPRHPWFWAVSDSTLSVSRKFPKLVVWHYRTWSQAGKIIMVVAQPSV